MGRNVFWRARPPVVKLDAQVKTLHHDILGSLQVIAGVFFAKEFNQAKRWKNQCSARWVRPVLPVLLSDIEKIVFKERNAVRIMIPYLLGIGIIWTGSPFDWTRGRS